VRTACNHDSADDPVVRLSELGDDDEEVLRAMALIRRTA
jgi:radical SAM superfamily enzyme with C-terminal helix-hairpin-helix motif